MTNTRLARRAISRAINPRTLRTYLVSVVLVCSRWRDYLVEGHAFAFTVVLMEGYAKLASLMGAHPEVAILRRFGGLNAQNLLYLQAEIMALESQLNKDAAQDCASNDTNRMFHSRDWYTLSRPKDDGDDGDEAAGRQWQTMLSIREKLKEYSSLTILYCNAAPSYDYGGLY